MKKLSQARAFTLVELLTVIAIITLLIGILVPSLSAARDQARRASTAGQLAAIEKGAIAFQADNEKYPASRGYNPFEQASANVALSGAQWLAAQLMGPDLQGWIKPVDTNNDNRVNEVDWLNMYWSPGSSRPEPTKKFSRVGPYVDVNGKFVASLDQYREINTGAAAPPAALTLGSSEWSNSRVPFFVDTFGYPVLYYRAERGAEQPITTGTTGPQLRLGVYDQSDNLALTGSEGTDGRYPANAGGWDVAGRGEATTWLHPLGKIGYRSGDTQWPEKGTFAANICDRNIFDTTQQGGRGRLWPHKPDTFIIISAGKDGVYGNEDDIRNFGAGN
jgi:prepilin-type N-terminal cleavage/methylation domain-containing protein